LNAETIIELQDRTKDLDKTLASLLEGGDMRELLPSKIKEEDCISFALAFGFRLFT